MSLIDHLELYDNLSRFPAHKHLSNEMIFVIDGKITLTCGETDYIILPGQLCLVPVGVEHATDKYPERYKRWIININPWEFAKYYFSPRIQAMLSGMLLKRPIISMLGESGAEVIELMYAEIRNEKPFFEDMAASNLIFLLSTLARDNISDISQQLSASAQTVMKAQIYIQQNCALPLKINEVADRFFSNKYYFTHIFTEFTGMSPKQFQISCRLQKARQLLSTDMSVSEIAERCGFSSLGDMTGRFKIRYGHTPAEYRNLLL